MLVEFDNLTVVIVGRPVFDENDLPQWKRLCERFMCCFIVDAEHVAAWQVALPQSANVFAWNRTTYNPVATGIRTALDRADAQPHNAVYVTSDADDLWEATSTRVGTLQIGTTLLETLPDECSTSLAMAVDALYAVKDGIIFGWFAEARAMCLGSGGRSDGFMLHAAAGGNAGDSVPVWFMGRYFTRTDERHTKHQLSLRLLKAKREAASRKVLADPLAWALRWLAEHNRIDHIVHVPPRPSETDDHIGEMVRAAAELSDECHRTNLQAMIEDRAVWCVREYGEQKYAGNYKQRVENVSGAFRASSSLRGKSILVLDDIVTSGATIAEVAETMRRAGAGDVCGLAVARTQSYTALNPHVLACRRGCGGWYCVRFNSRNGSAFWGCTSYPTCTDTLSWSQGILWSNELSKREDIVPREDVPF